MPDWGFPRIIEVMKRTAYFVLGVLATGVPAGLPSGAASATDTAEPYKITMSAKDCRRLVKYRGQQDAAYKPGVDVRGNKVAGADVEGSPKIELPEEITFVLSASLAKYFAKPGIENPIRTSEGVIGKIRYNTLTGKLAFNGQPLSDPAADEIVVMCREILTKGH
jgi:hypothetical protein